MQVLSISPLWLLLLYLQIVWLLSKSTIKATGWGAGTRLQEAIGLLGTYACLLLWDVRSYRWWDGCYSWSCVFQAQFSVYSADVCYALINVVIYKAKDFKFWYFTSYFKRSVSFSTWISWIIGTSIIFSLKHLKSISHLACWVPLYLDGVSRIGCDLLWFTVLSRYVLFCFHLY